MYIQLVRFWQSLPGTRRQKWHDIPPMCLVYTNNVISKYTNEGTYACRNSYVGATTIVCKFAVNVCQVYYKKAKKRFRSHKQRNSSPGLDGFRVPIGYGYGLSVSQSKPRDHSKLGAINRRWETFGSEMTFTPGVISLSHMQAQTGPYFHKIWGKNDIYLTCSHAGTGRHSFPQNLGQKWHLSDWFTCRHR